MKVLKFGGTSVGSAENIKKVKEIVCKQPDDVIVVVSAVGGITDKILKAANNAACSTDDFHTEITEIRTIHDAILNELFNDSDDVKKQVTRLLKELEQILTGIRLVGELTAKTLDRIVGIGERISSHIVARFIEAERIDSSALIQTDCNFGKASVNFEVTNRCIREKFAVFKGTAVMPGFIAQNNKGECTTLGRGGSDFTAAIIAAALDVDILEIWTDVNGFMTADPRIIRKAYTIPELTYSEAMELSHFGAKVIYPPTILPVYQKGIPIQIKNTFSPEKPGTKIVKKVKNGFDRPIKGISSISGIALLTLQGLGMVGVTGISQRLFAALASVDVNAILISQASSENSISVAIDEKLMELARKTICKEFEKEIAAGQVNKIQFETDVAVVAIVGENMKKTTGIAGKLFSTIGKSGINIFAIAQGASELNISWVVKNGQLRKTLNIVHEAFFLSEFAELNIFLMGIGTVGSKLLQQIQQQQELLLEKQHLRLKLTGVANSKKMLFNREGINIETFREQLDESDKTSGLQAFVDEMKAMNIYNSVFVDCTASADVANLYQQILGANVSIVAANKVAASSEYDNYSKLKQIAKDKGVKFLFETNVGAGLPIINTLHDLVNSGDKIQKIEAVLSGTLNFIFNTISQEIPFSKTIQMAKDEGYAEPDPRIDLSGMDVARKILILARESGNKIEMEDISIRRFVPDALFDGTLDEFWRDIANLDAGFEEQRKKLYAGNKKWRFVARFENGKAEAGLEEVESTHPFYDLEGSNNLIMFTTERYHEFPMLIKGYGAGASVPAAGVFSDLIKVSNI